MVDVLTTNPEVHIQADKTRTAAQKVAIFQSLFRGREDVYGTYDPSTGKARQVKAPVTYKVVHGHLVGKAPYGVYFLVEDKTQAVAVDFDEDDPMLALEFLRAAEHYDLPTYIERSKSKGYHAWTWFELPGVLAAKARLVVRHILAEIGKPNTEVFPKQDALDDRNLYGNFINAPLFGRFVSQGKTVFLDPDNGLKAYVNQWDFLQSVQRVPEQTLDDIIEVNNLVNEAPPAQATTNTSQPTVGTPTFGLPPCAQRMLAEGVTENQRVACFRLAVDLKKAGVPLDVAIAALNIWALKNQPRDDKSIITRQEIMAQTASAYSKPYRSRGCDDPTMAPYCDETCPIRGKKHE
jgi:hypothetical protein